MPSLEWIGKDKVIGHHREVPYRPLSRLYSFGGEGSSGLDGGNAIVHGDSLDALKALMPRFAGRVKCALIDPPYNTGNEGWRYSDSVNDPRMKKWLGQVVGREGEDMTRHDKWLCMMYPRLRLIRELLSDDGAIFIHIDDNEEARLRLLCDEIFGTACFVSNISWQRTYSTRNDSKGIVSEAEHIIVFSKRPGWQPNKLPRTAAMDAKYKNPDNDYTDWRSDNPFAPGAATHQGMVYAIQHPFTGKMLYPSANACWRYQQDTMLEIMRGWCGYELRDIGDAAKRAEVCGVAAEAVREGIPAIVLSQSLEESGAAAREVYKRGRWPRFYFTKGGAGGIARKTYLENVGGQPPTNLWPYSETGHTDEASKELKAIFGGAIPFDTPKPSRLEQRVLQIATDKDSIVLDCFAGSGTTAHAVLKLNREDGGSRRFILAELMDYAESLTAERVRRVITGYGEGSSAAEGTGGGFAFYEPGAPLFTPEGELAPDADADALREYIWFTETRAPMPAERGSKYWLGTDRGAARFLIWDEGPGVLDRSFLATVTERAESYVVYAASCALPNEELSAYNITFKKLPRDITRF